MVEGEYHTLIISARVRLALTAVLQKLSISYWTSFISSFFVDTALTKFVLWKDRGNESKPFSESLIPRTG